MYLFTTSEYFKRDPFKVILFLRGHRKTNACIESFSIWATKELPNHWATKELPQVLKEKMDQF